VVVVVTFAPSPSFAVIVVKISKPVHIVLFRSKAPGLDEGIMTVDRSRVGMGEVYRTVRIGAGAIGKAVHAVRQKGRRKKQEANSYETTAENKTAHFYCPVLGYQKTEAGRDQTAPPLHRLPGSQKYEAPERMSTGSYNSKY
jgi:hypothetical protein